MTFRTRFQRGKAACELMRDLELRTTNPVIKEYCHIAYTLIAAPVNERAAIDGRAAELVAAAEARRKRLESPRSSGQSEDQGEEREVEEDE